MLYHEANMLINFEDIQYYEIIVNHINTVL